jgi:rhodanese-related sulfurtransferase
MSTAKEQRRLQAAVYEQLARIGKAISNPARLQLLELLAQGPRTVEVLAQAAGLGIPNASQQLKALRVAGLVQAEKHGLFVTYRLADAEVGDFLESLRVLAERRLGEVAEMVKSYREERAALEPVDRKRLWERIRRGAVTVLDVRPVEEYRAGHLEGAVSIPLSQLKRRLAEIPKGREIVAYCRGRYCVMAVEAVELLRARGYQAWRVEEGVREFRELGLRIAVG